MLNFSQAFYSTNKILDNTTDIILYNICILKNNHIWNFLNQNNNKNASFLQRKRTYL